MMFAWFARHFDRLHFALADATVPVIEHLLASPRNKRTIQSATLSREGTPLT